MLTVVAVVSAGCSSEVGPPLGTGDPGNRGLHRLQQEEFISSLPPGAKSSGSSRWTPATWDSIQHLWKCPCFTRGFNDTQPPTQVLAFYKNRAQRFGWLALAGTTSNGVGMTWQKKYPLGYAVITLQSGYNAMTHKTSSHAFTLYGGAPTVGPRPSQ